GHPFWMFLLSIFFTVACVSGTICLAKRSKMLQYPLFACPFVSMLLVWHYEPMERFIVPLFPLLLAGFSTEALRLCSLAATALRSPNRAERSLALGAWACLFALFGMAVSTAHRHVSENIPQAIADYRAKLNEGRSVYRWISGNLPVDATFLAERDALLFLYTGRTAATQFPSTKLMYRGDQQAMRASIDHIADFAREEGLSYYYIGKDDLGPEVRRTLLDADFQQVYQSGASAVYRIRSASARMSAAP